MRRSSAAITPNKMSRPAAAQLSNGSEGRGKPVVRRLARGHGRPLDAGRVFFLSPMESINIFDMKRSKSLEHLWLFRRLGCRRWLNARWF